MAKAIEDFRRWQERLARRGGGIPRGERPFAKQVAGMHLAAQQLQLPANIDGLSALTTESGESVFVWGVSVFGGPDVLA